MSLASDARFSLVSGFERSCDLAASSLMSTETLHDNACSGGCSQLCLATSPPRLCLGFECRAQSGACLLFSTHPNRTVPRVHSECWRRRLRSEAEIMDEGVDVGAGSAPPINAIDGISVDFSGERWHCSAAAALAPGSRRGSTPAPAAANTRSIPLLRWALLHATCRYSSLPLLHPSVIRSVSSLCAVDEVGFVGNHRPLVTTLDRWGEAQATLFPGFWRAYPWDTAGRGTGSASGHEIGADRPGTPLMTGHDVFDMVRVVYVANALVTPNGNLCDRVRCYSDAASFAGDPRHPLVSSVERESCSSVVRLVDGEHAIVIRQEFGHTFSHALFQMLPQLVVLFDSYHRQPRIEHRRRPLRVLLKRWEGRGPSPLPSLIRSAFPWITDANISIDDASARKGAYTRADSASILLTPPGTNPNEGIFGRGILRRAHARLVRPLADHVPNDKIVYLYRQKHMGRYVWNEPELMAMLKTQLKRPRYSESLVMLGPHSVNNSWRQMRELLATTRVLLGPHGSAWGHLIFLPLHRGNVHLIELHYLRHRTCYPKLHHYVGGLSHYWVVEPEPWGQKHAWLTSQRRPMSGSLISMPLLIRVAEVHTILWHAGVANCERTIDWQPPPDNVWKLGSLNSSFRCATRPPPPLPAPPAPPPTPPRPPPLPCPTLEEVLAVVRHERWKRYDDPGCTFGCRARRCRSTEFPCCWKPAGATPATGAAALV